MPEIADFSKFDSEVNRSIPLRSPIALLPAPSNCVNSSRTHLQNLLSLGKVLGGLKSQFVAHVNAIETVHRKANLQTSPRHTPHCQPAGWASTMIPTQTTSPTRPQWPGLRWPRKRPPIVAAEPPRFSRNFLRRDLHFLSCERPPASSCPKAPLRECHTVSPKRRRWAGTIAGWNPSASNLVHQRWRRKGRAARCQGSPQLL
mmetsp:Transcript_40462/g.86188  ORF Transcript_40462/g.86188 Transcript_40462/m.86188 type:complete len:202 (-) Transcript_40462:1247-1852(-)